MCFNKGRGEDKGCVNDEKKGGRNVVKGEFLYACSTSMLHTFRKGLTSLSGNFKLMISF